MAQPDDSRPEDNTSAGDEQQGDDVARDPDVIQREIEQTRAELADTIDALADRVSPKRAASRAGAAVKAQVSSVFDRGGEASDRSEPPAAVLDAAPEAAEDRTEGVRQVAARGGGTQFTGTSQFTVARQLRTDRVLILIGVGAAVTALVIVRRSRR
jgi:hypothetical protein